MPDHPVEDPFNQPAQLDLGIAGLRCGPDSSALQVHSAVELPFCTLRSYSIAGRTGTGAALVVPPLSGHFPVLFRDFVLGVLQHRNVHVAEWKNARHVSLENGPFGFEHNIEYIVRMIEALGPDLNVIGICQSAVPALAAVSVLSEKKSALAPHALVLLGGAIDPMANPTRVVALLRERSLEWFYVNVIQRVTSQCAGKGRLVYPAHIQLTGLLGYLTRHVQEGRELSRKLTHDDGSDPKSFPFLRLYTAIMDLPVELFMENIETVYHERRILDGRLTYRGETVRPEAIEATALMTIEGLEDDIAAPGQTFAAHRICRNIPGGRRKHFVVADAGHFSLFHGDRFRADVLPQIDRFITSLSTHAAE
ncbi:MAG: hypothetical protein APF80_10355 [Alphaproteobacteria bacterium BRH_c36]|nr:MAG: hypothetical protein APF80_10355 [Alphaproteobacteria bacterium BRH_c36]